jgi:hypothetical protein
LYDLGLTCLYKYKESVKNKKVVYNANGRPYLIKDEKVPELKKFLHETVPGKKDFEAKNVEAFNGKIGEIVAQTKVDDGKSHFDDGNFSEITYFRVKKRVKAVQTSKASTITEPRKRELPDTANFFVEACILEQYVRNAPPMCVINLDAVQYGLGKDNILVKV